MKQKLITPNNLTLARLVLSAGFFVIIAYCKPMGSSPLLFDISVALFVLAGLTDMVDGYVARKYSMETSLGRLLDPFVDKVMICGAFVFFLGANFVVNGQNVTGLAPWMVICVMGRELLVTSLRGHSEAKGHAFPATVQGKIKMFLQSATVVAILISIAHFPHADWARMTRMIFIWVMVIFTLTSMMTYLTKYFSNMNRTDK